MSTLQDNRSSLPLSQRILHANVERQGLALGASRERTRRAVLVSAEDGNRLQKALEIWENEGGSARGHALGSQPKLFRELSKRETFANLFRDDTLSRAVVMNGLLLLVAALGVFILNR